MWRSHTLQRNYVAVCENCGLSQLKQMNDNVLYMFSGYQYFVSSYKDTNNIPISWHTVENFRYMNNFSVLAGLWELS